MKGSEAKMTGFMEGADKRFVIPVYQRKYAVSYTHLDVYKRQVSNTSLWVSFLSIRFSFSVLNIIKGQFLKKAFCIPPVRTIHIHEASETVRVILFEQMHQLVCDHIFLSLIHICVL